MNKQFSLTRAAILVVLIVLILAPRPFAGSLDLKSAIRFESVGNAVEAEQSYGMAAARIPWMPSLWEKAGLAAMEAGDNENAIVFFNEAIERHAISYRGWLALGIAYQKQGENSLAVKAWLKAIPLAPATSYLAMAERSSGNYTEASQYWRAAIAQEPGNAAAYYSLGLILMATSPEDALPELMKAAELDQDLDPTIQGLRTILNTGLMSNDPATHFLKAGEALAALSEWDLAEEAFHNAITRRPNFAEAWAWLGEAKQQQQKDGRLEIEKALSYNSESAMVQGMYGTYLQRQGKPDMALEAFIKAATLEPNNPAWQIALGSASEQSGDLISAYGYYLLAVELAPEDASTWRALATFCVKNNVDVDTSGMPAVLKLIGLAPNDWRSYDLAGQMEFLMEDYPAAENYLKKAVEMSPTQAAPALHLGLVYMQTGDRTSAYSYFNLAKTFDSEGPYGWQAGRLLEQYFP